MRLKEVRLSTSVKSGNDYDTAFFDVSANPQRPSILTLVKIMEHPYLKIERVSSDKSNVSYTTLNNLVYFEVLDESSSTSKGEKKKADTTKAGSIS